MHLVLINQKIKPWPPTPEDARLPLMGDAALLSDCGIVTGQAP
jgi:hypothetical protein